MTYRDLWWYVVDHSYLRRVMIMGVVGIAGLEVIVCIPVALFCVQSSVNSDRNLKIKFAQLNIWTLK